MYYLTVNGIRRLKKAAKYLLEGNQLPTVLSLSLSQGSGFVHAYV